MSDKGLSSEGRICVKFMDKSVPLFLRLLQRWEVEKKYEDINEYGKVISKKLPSNIKLLRMNKRPFGCDFRIGTKVYRVSISPTEYSWKRIG